MFKLNSMQIHTSLKLCTFEMLRKIIENSICHFINSIRVVLNAEKFRSYGFKLCEVL